MQQSKSDTGKLGEELTAYYLRKSGYEIIKRNFRVKGGEIDIIAQKGDIIAFVEVKTRDITAFQSGAAAVGGKKRSLVIKTALEYSYRYPHEFQPRFDIAEVTVKNGRVIKLRYFDNAFTASEDLTL